MCQKEKPRYCSNITPKSTKIFTYKGESYSVDFTLMKRSCKYFYDHRSEIKNNEKFEIEESISLPPETIQTFLNCCQNQPTEINDIFGINYLSIKYQNEDLMKFTQNYIENNYDELIFQSVYFKQKHKSNDIQLTNHEIEFDTNNEEKIISKHFLEYIDDEKIFSLSINVLDRVLKKFFSENKEICNIPTTKKKINNFLMNCLRKYKRDASVLFVNVGFDKFDRELIVSLHNEFSDIFDFNMIDSKSLFETTYELIGEIAQIQSLLKIISDQQKSQKNEFNEFKLKMEQEMNQKDQNQNQLSIKIQSVEENQSNAFVRMQTIENKNSDIEKNQISMNETLQKFNNIITSQNELISNLKKQIDDLNKKPVTIHYLNRDNHNGIIAFLGDSVVLSAGGYHDKREPLKNLRVYDNKTFYNYYNSKTNGSDYRICKSEKDSFIEFDFQNKKVDLFSYYIRSNEVKQDWYHAKSWRIMGSNDQKNWECLDIRFNISDLNRPYGEMHFQCQQSKYGNINNRFRYIRYIQTESCYDNRYNIYMSYFELYGDIYE